MQEPGVIRLSIPNPFFEGRNQVYVIPSDPVTMIDTGIATQKAFDTLRQELQQHGLSLADVQRVILTHKHIDHIGNAWRIQQESGAEILIHESEIHSVRDVDPDGHKFAALVQQCLSIWKAPNDALSANSPSSTWKWEIETSEATAIRDGQRLTQSSGELEVVHTPGHTMGSVCVIYGRYMFSGDHILPDISPNIGGGDMRNQGMLRHFLESLRRVADFAEDDVNVLPGHGEPFASLGERCDELDTHHRQRLDKVIEILERRAYQSVYEIACQLFGEMQDFHLVLGCAEAAAHLEYLEQEGRVAMDGARFRLV